MAESVVAETPLQSVIQANRQCLKTLSVQLSTLSNVTYNQATNLADHGIGAHVRHIIEHYHELASGLDNHAISYDKRKRDALIEQCPTAAINALDKILSWLLTLENNYSLTLTAATSGTKKASSCSSESNLVRELLFLQSHTIHHQAIIAILLKAQSIDVPDSFGVAPATLQYREDIEAVE